MPSGDRIEPLNDCPQSWHLTAKTGRCPECGMSSDRIEPLIKSRCGECGGELGADHRCGECGTQHNGPNDRIDSLRFAYADPPYVGGSHLYPEHPDAARWDDPDEHAMLMAEMDADYDGWALSASAPSFAVLLPAAPPGTRVAAWVKPFAAYKRHIRVAYSWEPVLWHRIAPRRDGEPVGRDHLSCPVTLQRGLVGAKPKGFADWLRVLLGYVEGDELTDLFPGTGAITDAFAELRLGL